jgi:hypothetical protein
MIIACRAFLGIAMIGLAARCAYCFSVAQVAGWLHAVTNSIA